MDIIAHLVEVFNTITEKLDVCNVCVSLKKAFANARAFLLPKKAKALTLA